MLFIASPDPFIVNTSLFRQKDRILYCAQTCQTDAKSWGTAYNLEQQQQKQKTTRKENAHLFVA